MKVIFCLGNPGSEYHKTRHNIGFSVGDALGEALKLEVVPSKYQAKLFSGHYKNEKVLLVYPQTFMNLSGKSVIAAIHHLKVPPSDCLVIYDDIDIAFGRLLMKPRGSAGTHNGMKSIVFELGSTDFPRLRVGIGPKATDMSLSDFVLGRFSKAEEGVLKEIQNNCVKAIQLWIGDTLERAMGQANTRTSNQTPIAPKID